MRRRLTCGTTATQRSVHMRVGGHLQAHQFGGGITQAYRLQSAHPIGGDGNGATLWVLLELERDQIPETVTRLQYTSE